MTRVRYTGQHAGSLPDYLDLATGKTLTVVPGWEGDVAPASGRLVPDIPGNCEVLDVEQEAAAEEAPRFEVAEPEMPAAETGDETEPGAGE